MCISRSCASALVAALLSGETMCLPQKTQVLCHSVCRALTCAVSCYVMLCRAMPCCAQIQDGDLVLLDMGCEYYRYGSGAA